MVSFAAAEQPPEPPLIVKGEVEINDEPASSGTQITAKLDGELIARSTVEKPGEYELHLLKMDDYTGITFTVDGTESQSSSEIAEKLNTANPTKATNLDMDVTESTGSGTNEVSVAPSSSGGFASPSSGSSTTNQNDDNTANTGGTDSETKGTTAGDSSPDANTGTNGETESQDSTASGPEETSSNIVLMVVGAIIIIGIIAAAGYKLKK
mgnify:CR=1 FL=1